MSSMDAERASAVRTKSSVSRDIPTACTRAAAASFSLFFPAAVTGAGAPGLAAMMASVTSGVIPASFGSSPQNPGTPALDVCAFPLRCCRIAIAPVCVFVCRVSSARTKTGTPRAILSGDERAVDMPPTPHGRGESSEADV